MLQVLWIDTLRTGFSNLITIIAVLISAMNVDKFIFWL